MNIKKILSLMGAIALITSCVSCSKIASVIDSSNSDSQVGDATKASDWTENATEGKTVTLDNTVQVVPEVLIKGNELEEIKTGINTLADYKQIAAKTDAEYEANIDEEYIYEWLEEQVTKASVFTSKDGAVKEDSSVFISISAVSTETKEPIYEDKYIFMRLDNNTFMTEINDAIIGKKAGDVFTIQSKFQDIPVDVTVTVNYIADESIIMANYKDLTEDMRLAFSKGEAKTEEEMIAFIKKQLEQTVVSTTKIELLYEIVDNSTFNDDVIAEQIDFYYNQGKTSYERYAEYYGYEDLKTLALEMGCGTEEVLLEQIKSDAESYVKCKIVILEILKEEGIEVTDELILEKATAIANENRCASITQYLTNNEAIDLRDDAMWRIITDILLPSVKLTNS